MEPPLPPVRQQVMGNLAAPIADQHDKSPITIIVLQTPLPTSHQKSSPQSKGVDHSRGVNILQLCKHIDQSINPSFPIQSSLYINSNHSIPIKHKLKPSSSTEISSYYYCYSSSNKRLN
uniref:Uncharacterized protein n=1 Tax=Oryza rufipogon TaxID=4529 RepID=A0A0E0QE35_ORYRU